MSRFTPPISSRYLRRDREVLGPLDERLPTCVALIQRHHAPIDASVSSRTAACHSAYIAMGYGGAFILGLSRDAPPPDPATNLTLAMSEAHSSSQSASQNESGDGITSTVRTEMYNGIQDRLVSVQCIQCVFVLFRRASATYGVRVCPAPTSRSGVALLFPCNTCI